MVKNNQDNVGLSHEDSSKPSKKVSFKALVRTLKLGKRSRALLFIAMFGLIGVFLLAASFAQKPDKNFTSVSKGVGGEVALEKLENRLPAVAQKYNIAPEKLRELFMSDPSLQLSNTDELYYVEPSMTEAEYKLLEGDRSETESSDDGVSSPSAAISPADAFNLNSKPGSEKTLYLDFTGHTTDASHWTKYNDGNTIVAAPYDHDGSPESFSETERQAIIDIWSSVAEDFIHYDINVTTVDYGLDALVKSSESDTTYGNRTVITPTNFYSDSAGGVSYINTWGQPKDYISWVFICCSTSRTKYISEAASHESGHSVGLHHDGTSTTGYYKGHGDWAPIMGNSYYEPLTQWSKGEYYDANQKEDDFALPLKLGIVYRNDEAGSTITSAAPLGISSNTTSRQGIIGRTGDVDVYSFSWSGGTATFEVGSTVGVKYFGSGVVTAGNLDPSVRLLDSSGAVIAEANPDGHGPATISRDIPAGSYYLEVKGVGHLDPLTTGYSTYSSIGQYAITSKSSTTTPSNQAPTAKITASTTTGIAPTTVNFTGSGSSDPEGDTLTYSWNLGNGTTSTAVNPSATYSSPGSYLVTLTVKDSGGLTSQASVTINITAPSNTITVSNLTGAKETETLRNGRTASYMSVVVTVTDTSGNPVSGITVSGGWSGVVTGSGSGITGSDGKTYIRSKTAKKSGDATFTINGVSSSNTTFNYVWDGVPKSVTVRL